MENTGLVAYYHLPGLFEFHEFYKVFLPLYYNHPEYFYDWAKIGSIYGAPQGCLWGGGRISCSTNNPEEVISLMNEYRISSRLTFSNSLLQQEHLADKKCNSICKTFAQKSQTPVGIIIHSDLLLNYLKQNYPDFYFVSSTTKVITDFSSFTEELDRLEFNYVVPDFRLNHQMNPLLSLSMAQKKKVEFLCNECCWVGCKERKECYENVSRLNLGQDCPEHICKAPESQKGYRFSLAMQNPAFISLKDIKEVYLPAGFANFKIEGRSLGSALILEFLLYYLTKPEYQIYVREAIYLDNTLDLF